MQVVQKKSATNTPAHPAAQPVVQSAPSVSTVNRLQIQAASKISSPGDPEEKEADSTAQKVMRMAIPDTSVSYTKTASGGVFRQVEPEDKEKIETGSKGKMISPYIARFSGVSIVSRRSISRQAQEQEEVQRQAQPEEEKIQRQAAPEEENIQKKTGREEEQVQRQAAEEEEETVQRQAVPEEEKVQRQGAEEETIRRQIAEEKEETVQRQAALEEEKVQRQGTEEETVQRQVVPEEEKIQKQAEPEEETVQRQVAGEDAEETVQRQPAQEEEKVQRQVDAEEEPVQRKAEGMPNIAANIDADIRRSMSGGKPLPLSVRRYMEPRFKADFSGVKIHNDESSAKLNRKIQARAFAVKNHIFFGEGQYSPESGQGRELIAHELTHTIQQGAAVQRKENVTVSQQSSTTIQRVGISDALDYFAGKARHIPGFTMLTVILGVNPINMESVDRNAANILRAVIEFLPGGGLITQAMENHGVFDTVGTWVEEQFNTLSMTGAMIKNAVMEFLDSLGWRDIFDLGGVWTRAKRIFTEPVTQLINFGKSLISGIIKFIKDAVLMPLAELASQTAGWDLLIAVLGFNPITGDEVERNAENLLGGFMKFIGQEEVWNNLQESNAVERAWAWFQGALAGLVGFVSEIPGMFINAFKALEIVDIILIPRALAKVASVFVGFAGQFVSWGLGQVIELLKIILEVVAPGVIPFLKKAGAAFTSIVKNPVGFVGNLVTAGKMGFMGFASKFLTYLKASLISWLTGAMSGAGVYIPQGFTIKEILKFVLSVLGLTWANLRVKLVKAVGETAVKAMEKGFELVKTLVTEGPAAAWKKIVEGIENLKDMVMEQIMSFVKSKIVTAAVTKLVSMLSPAGAFIQAIISIYNTIMFFIERLSTIMRVAQSFVNSIAAIAAGNLAAAAARVEATMAGMLTLVISFLARFAGLGRVSDAVKKVIDRVRAPISKAMDRVVAWVVAQARKLGRFVAQAGVPKDPKERVKLASRAAVGAAKALKGKVTKPLLAAALSAIKVRYGLTDIQPYKKGKVWWVKAKINPEDDQSTGVPTEGSSGSDTVPAVIDQVLQVQFLNGVGRPGEYTRQLGLQQAAINQMPVASWIANRNQYNARRRSTGSGRHPDAARVQRESRAVTTTLLVDRLTRGERSRAGVVGQVNADSYLAAFVNRAFSGATPAQKRSGFSASTAASRVVTFMSRQHALHNPDQVAGGEHDPNETLGMGRAEVNRDIGANWGGFRKPRHLANTLHALVNNTKRRMRRGKQWAQSVWAQIKMKVALKF